MMAVMRDQPLIAVDVAPVSSTGESVRFGTALRRFEPHLGEHALPGVLLGPTERLRDAAHRALREKAGIPEADVLSLTQIGAFDSPGRDPRDAAISISFLAVVPPSAGDVDVVQWHAEVLSGLPFDHDEIVATARVALARSLWADVPLTRGLTGDVFTTTVASDLEEQVTGVKPHSEQLRRRLSAHPSLVLVTDAPAGPVGRGRPALTWRWVE